MTARGTTWAWLVAACMATGGCYHWPPPRADRQLEPAAQSASGHESGLPVGYADDSQCQACHADLYAAYQEVAMSQSFYAPDRHPWIEDFQQSHYYHPLSNQHFEMELRDGELYQRRYVLGDDGQRQAELEVKVDYILGSGRHVRCYVYRTPSGELFQLPLAWYSQEKKWRLNPGYDRPLHAGFQRPITRECMFCHNAYPTSSSLDAAVKVSDAHGTPHLFPETLPQGIGCQRCHGPGAEHVRLANHADTSVARIHDSIVNPAKLAPDLRDDVCHQCHLQPSSQFLSEMVRTERGEYSFRAGQPLQDFRALLDAKLVDYQGRAEAPERFEINHHAYRLRQSRCVTESPPGELSCISCHDPHRKLPVEQRQQRYARVCASCHGPSDCTEQADLGADLSKTTANETTRNCAACHMPGRRTQDAVHVVMTDHKITARPGSAEQRLQLLQEPQGPPRQITPHAYFETQRRDNSLALYEAIAAAQTGEPSQVQRLQQTVEASGTVDVQAWLELVNAWRLAGGVDQVRRVLDELIALHPSHPQVNLEMGICLAELGEHTAARAYYERAWQYGALLPDTQVGLGVSWLQTGEFQAASQHFQEALRLRPYYPEALLNLAITYSMQRQWAAARSTFERAWRADPTLIEARTALDELPR